TGPILASASVKLSGYGVLRGRAGWAYENFRPYAMIGLAVGREEASRVTTVTGTPTPTSLGTAFVDTQGDSISRVPWGYSAGVGADVQLSSSVFLRAEYEFVQFLGVSTIRTHVSTVRGGAGFRF